MSGRRTNFFWHPVLPHKCGVPPGYGTPHLCGSEEFFVRPSCHNPARPEPDGLKTSNLYSPFDENWSSLFLNNRLKVVSDP